MKARWVGWAVWAAATAACGGGGNRSDDGVGAVDGPGSRIDASTIADGGIGPDGDPAGTWRSALYPPSWTPAFTGDGGQFLHDFSYAGYHRSEVALPTTWPGDVFNVTSFGAVAAPVDSTKAFVAAIAAAQTAGGGVVYVPDGEYRLKGNLLITGSHVLLRGQSRAGTKLSFSSTAMNGHENISFVGAAVSSTGHVALIADGVARNHDVEVADASGFAVGNDVLIDATITQAFIDEHGMWGVWDDASNNSALGARKVFFRRQITAIVGGTITLDVPLRMALPVRDAPTIRLDTGALIECGIEQVSINNAVDTAAAAASPRAHAVGFDHVTDCFVRDLGTYDSSFAPTTDHLQSGGIMVANSKRVTVADSSIMHAQNHGDGGAGYGYEASVSNEILFRDDHVEDVRHGFIQNWDFGSSGLVWLRGDAVDDTAVNGGFTSPGRSEFHHRLAIACLFDSTRDTAGFASYNRGTQSSNAGHAGTENVFWNVRGQDAGTFMSIYQVGHGYVIGTRNITPKVEPDIIDELRGLAEQTEPIDLLEGQDQGATLWPPSLFEDQLTKRLGR